MTTNTVMADSPIGPRIATLILLLILGFPHPLWASTLTVEPDEKTYHFVSHYRVVIDATATTVWKHLVNSSTTSNVRALADLVPLITAEFAPCTRVSNPPGVRAREG